jgi:hypothetical protein
MNIKPKINFFQNLSQKDKLQIQYRRKYLGVALAIAGGLLVTGYFALLLPATSQTTSVTNKSSADLGKELVGQIRECVQGKLNNPPSNQQPLQAISMGCVFEVAVLEKNGKVRIDASDRLSALFAATGFKPENQNSRFLWYGNSKKN